MEKKSKQYNRQNYGEISEILYLMIYKSFDNA